MTSPKVRATVRHSSRADIPSSTMAVLLALAGNQEPLVPAEIREVVDILSRRRWSAVRIARHLGCSDRTVVRHRRALRAAR